MAAELAEAITTILDLIRPLKSPISVFQNGDDLVQVSRYFGGPVDQIVNDWYSMPQVVTAGEVLVDANNAFRNDTSGLSGYLLENLVLENLHSERRPRAIFSQFGGSETRFYINYRMMVSNSSAVMLLCRPKMDCSVNGEIWEEEHHIRKLVSCTIFLPSPFTTCRRLHVAL